jgi:hypothetical protein
LPNIYDNKGKNRKPKAKKEDVELLVEITNRRTARQNVWNRMRNIVLEETRVET